MRVLTEERDRLKELGLTAEDKQKMEAQLAEVKLDNSKLATDLSKATEDMQQLTTRAEAAEGEVASLKDKLKEEQTKSQELDNEKAQLEVSLKACKEEIAEYRQAILQLEEDKLLAFESGILVARDHADRSKVWDQIDWTTIRIPSNIEATVPPYFRQPGKIRKLSQEYDKQCETSKGKEKQ